MGVRETERAAVDLCLSAEPGAAPLQQLGDARIWSLYRDMVRNRLLGEIRIALKRSAAAAGDGALARAFAHHMAEAPPTARFFHAIVGDFARAAAPYFRSQSDVPAYLGDLVEYEAAVWAVGDLDDRPPSDELGEFSFDAAPVVAPATRLLALQHAVHGTPAEDGGYAVGEVFLCVHRAPDAKKARTWTLNAVTHDLLGRFQERGQSVSEAVREVATAREIAVDEAFIEGLCTVLADFIERGIILGCRTP